MSINSCEFANQKQSSRRHFIRVASAACLAGFAAALGGCASADSGDGEQTSSEEDALQTATIFAFDTVVTLRADCSAEAMQRAVDLCEYFEQKFSRTIEGSDIWNINTAEGEPVEVAEETAELIAKSLEYCARSKGLFDITIGAVSSLWDFKAGIKPADEAIQEAIKHVDYTMVNVEGTRVTLADPAGMLDLGGTAKGYIADELAQLFRDEGSESAIINLGGNVVVVGSKPDGSDWRVGIQDPNGVQGASVIASVDCSDRSVVTSGLYERNFYADGERYYHILDPRTGYPAETDLISSSIISSSSIDGDGYSTWVFLLGREKALELLESTEELEGIVIDKDGTVYATENANYELR